MVNGKESGKNTKGVEGDGIGREGMVSQKIDRNENQGAGCRESNRKLNGISIQATNGNEGEGDGSCESEVMLIEYLGLVLGKERAVKDICSERRGEQKAIERPLLADCTNSLGIR